MWNKWRLLDLTWFAFKVAAWGILAYMILEEIITRYYA